jgi:hypothetical protein
MLPAAEMKLSDRGVLRYSLSSLSAKDDLAGFPESEVSGFKCQSRLALARLPRIDLPKEFYRFL